MTSDQSSDSTIVGAPPGHGLIRNILLIDQPEFTTKLAAVVRAFGWNPIVAANAGQARGLMERFRPDFIISEVILPGETGFEYCAFQKRLNCRVPVMFLTHIRLGSARNLAMSAGADAYLTKPVQGRILYQQILTVAMRVSRQVAQAEQGMNGAIVFRCQYRHSAGISGH